MCVCVCVKLAFYSFSFLRHPPGHAYFDPNDFLEGIQQDIEREELEYEVKYHLHPSFSSVFSMKIYIRTAVHYCSISRAEVASVSPVQWPC